jgi:hypothetical protein
MTIAASIIALLFGAILLLASALDVIGDNLGKLGLILIIAGALGIALSTLVHAVAARRGRRAGLATRRRG